MGLSDSRARTWRHKKGNLEITYSKLPFPFSLTLSSYTFCFGIHPLTDIWVVSARVLFYKSCCCEHSVGIVGSRGHFLFNFLTRCETDSHSSFAIFDVLPAVHKGSNFFTFLPAVVVVSSDHSHLGGCAAVFHPEFNLHFLND